MKLLTDIINNKLVSEEVSLSTLPKDSTFYVEVKVYSRIRESYSSEVFACKDFSLFEDLNFTFNQQTGKYICIINNKDDFKHNLAKLYNSPHPGHFPYETIRREYNCFNALEAFKKTALQNLVITTPPAKSIKYTFGLEYETSCGYIPEEECYKHGLIPLHDGSITGIEYTSIVLDNTYGFSLLQKQLSLLSKLTTYDKECALHIHMGGYPVDIKAVYALYLVCMHLQQDLTKHNCPAVFNTDLYKKSGKNYCQSYTKIYNFAEFCYVMSAGHTENIKNLTAPHPADNAGDRKWNINIRYFWVNFINILFFNRAKTIEFRFLRPSYNYNKIVNWIYIFNAILAYSEQLTTTLNKMYLKHRKTAASSSDEATRTITWHTFFLKYIPTLKLETIVSEVYSGDVLKQVLKFLDSAKAQSAFQRATDDTYGRNEIKQDPQYYLSNPLKYD